MQALLKFDYGTAFVLPVDLMIKVIEALKGRRVEYEGDKGYKTIPDAFSIEVGEGKFFVLPSPEQIILPEQDALHLINQF